MHLDLGGETHLSPWIMGLWVASLKPGCKQSWQFIEAREEFLLAGDKRSQAARASDRGRTGWMSALQCEQWQELTASNGLHKFHLVASSLVHFLPSAPRHQNNKMKHAIICTRHLHNEDVDVSCAVWLFSLGQARLFNVSVTCSHSVNTWLK